MTSKAIFELDIEQRDLQGKGASRRLRRLQNKVPAILYGGGEKPSLIMLDQLKVLHALEHDAFYSHILTLNHKGKKQQVVLKDLQRHHFKKTILHMDFLRVKPTDIIQMRVPIHYKGEAEAPGIVESSGVINHHMIDIEVRCQVQALPESIEIDVSKMILDQIIHLSDINFPKGVESVVLSHGKEHDRAVVSIHLPRIVVEEEVVAEVSEEEEGTEAAGTTAAAGSGGAAAGATATAKGAESKGKDDSKAKPAQKPDANKGDKGKK